MRVRVLALVLMALLAVTLTGCLFKNITAPNPLPPVIPEEPGPEIELSTSRVDGKLCSLERSLPAKIEFNKRFSVRVVIEAKQPVQSIYLEEDGWFREFRLIQEPIQLWLRTGTGEQRVLAYDVEMWLLPPEIHQFMFGSVSCNLGGLGESEILQLESSLKPDLK